MTRPVTSPGRLVAGRYRLQSQIGGGGMGTVWLAQDERLGRQVAIKQVLTPAGMTPEETDQQRQRALREGRIAARLSHPHAISVYDVALESGQPWLVMEYLPSRSLAAVLTEDGVLRPDQVAQIGAQVADALAATHAAGIVHRDVKPANILIGEGGRIEGLVKITDFGISHASGDVTLTQTGQLTGTPAFLAPEVAQGHEMTRASDVFSLGATLYTCVEGQPPFGVEDNALAMLHRVAGGSMVPPSRAASLTDPLTRMLAADPVDRPSMTEVRDELATLAAGRGGDTTTVLLARTDLNSAGTGRNRTAALPSPTPVPPPPTHQDLPAGPPASPTARPAPRGPRRGRALWVLAGLAAVVLAGLIVFWTVGADDDPSDRTAAPTSAATTSAEPTDGTEASTGEEEPAATSQPTSSSAEQPVDPAAAATQFFAAVPGDLQTAYQLTSPTFQGEFPFEERFAFFWRQFSSVQIGDVVSESDTTALVDITYVQPDGSSATERHRLTFVRADDGRLLLDRDEPA